MNKNYGGIKMNYTIEADLHTHTVASGHAFSTVKEMVESAVNKGLKTIAITDHGLNMPGGPHIYYFYKLLELPGRINGVQVLKGVEANIIDENGKLDMPEYILEKLDIVLAGFHNDTGFVKGSAEKNTRAMIAAINNQYVHIITHPGNPEYPVDMEKIVIAAGKAGKVLELNNSSLKYSRVGSLPRCRNIAKIAADNNIYVSINSDAHNCYEIGSVDKALELAKKEGINPRKIINTSVDLVNSYIKSVNKRYKKIS